MRVEANNAYDAWYGILNAVSVLGKPSRPRGMLVQELLGTQVVLTDLRNNVLCSTLRDLNYRFMIAEWLWIQTGREDVASIARYNKEIARFSDDGEIFNGAYGPRLSRQWDWVLAKLREDSDSRQALAVIFTPCPTPSKDVPCTVALQLLVREGKLHGIMTMRSNDLWLGFPYDLFNFSQIVNAVAGELGVDTGSLTLQAGSSHVYEANFEKVATVLANPESGGSLRSPRLPGLCRNPAILTNEFISGNVYEEYALALRYPTKAQALNVLRRLSQDA